MTDLKKQNAVTNERIQHLAVKVTDKCCSTYRRDLNELMTLVMPKLKFYIWGFMSSAEDTEDVLFNALEKIVVSIGTYNPEYRFTTWAYHIAKNEALTWLNKKPKGMVDLDECFGRISNTVIDESQIILEREKQRDTVLTDVYREIQRCAIEEGYTMILEYDINRRKGKDIAEHYEISENTVKTRIRAGRKRVRENLVAMHPDLVTYDKKDKVYTLSIFDLD